MKKILILPLFLIIIFGFISCYHGGYTDVETTTTMPETTTEMTTWGDETTTGDEITMAAPTLSSECDKVIYTIRDGSDYYEFVVNEEIGYPRNSYEFGIIKNNEWLVEMSKNSPFLNDDNTWKMFGQFDHLENITFRYLGEGCFLYEVNSSGIGILYNPTTGVVCNADISRYDHVARRNSYVNCNNSERMKKFDKIVRDGQVLIFNDKYQLVLLNTVTGEEHIINGYFETGNELIYIIYDRFQGISDGLFMAQIQGRSVDDYTQQTIIGFFDINGELIIDLSKYDLSVFKDYYFKDGQCILTAYNESGTKLSVTIDKSGNMINIEPVED